VKGEQLDKLKVFCVQALGKSFTEKMFSSDFKLHCECIESYSFIMQEQPESLREILDIIFKWTLVQLISSANTKFAVNVFDFLQLVFSHLEDTGY
jgi:hypothetical protein